MYAFHDRNSLLQLLQSLKSTCHDETTAIARSIADAIVNMDADYGLKLELLHTALQHRIFAKSSILQRRMKRATPAKTILEGAMREITNSKEKLILC